MAKRGAIRFPSYVPSFARRYLEERIDDLTGPDDATALDGFEYRREILERLATDCRMKEAYRCLACVVREERQWDRIFITSIDLEQKFYTHFLRAAEIADRDFEAMRAERKRIIELRNKISAAADQLINNLTELHTIADMDDLHQTSYEMDWPDGLFRLPELCYRNATSVEGALQQKRIEKLAEAGLSEGPMPTHDTDLTHTGNAQEGAVVDLGEFLNALRRSSECTIALEALVPRAVDIVRIIASAAHGWEPKYNFEVGAALASRKNTRKTQYIRAFWYGINHHLVSGKPFDPPSVEFLTAIAITADVILNDESNDVSVADVRSALHSSLTE